MSRPSVRLEQVKIFCCFGMYKSVFYGGYKSVVFLSQNARVELSETNCGGVKL